PVTWKSYEPGWVGQWPLPKEKLLQLHRLVDEQLKAGHIVPTTSPWNTPVFWTWPPQKKNNSWRLLHDLRKINEVIEDMGALQPGLPSPTMLPQTWTLIITDLKDCFFTIPLAPQDAPQFAFSVPSINAAESKQTAQKVKWQAIQAVSTAGIKVAEEKIQETPPWQYLGWKISEQNIQPQNIALRTEIKTLNDLQKLLGTITWIHPLLGISTEELHPLFKLLEGDPCLTSPQTLTLSVRTALDKVIVKLTGQVAHWRKMDYPISLFIFYSSFQPYGLLAQWVPQDMHLLIILEWIFLPHNFVKTVTTAIEMVAMVIHKGRERLLSLDGVEPNIIYPPLDTKQLTFLTHQSFVFQCALVDFTGQISIHFPGHKIIQSLHSLPLLPTSQLAITPIAEALTVFTDGSGKTGRAVIVWRDSERNWKSDIDIVTGSPQVVELSAVVRVFKLWTTPINIITDFAYVAGLVSRLEHASLKEVSNGTLFTLLWELKWLLDRRAHPYFIQHICSHTSLPGP
ncbi:POK11 protein, partial [Eolophus roseicapillus]|nr:POK11 protein [Eolophus roseicapilla]